jgi:DNA polymerase III delta subunit
MSKGVVYLLLGPETGEKELFIDGIRKRIVEQTGSSPEESRFYPYDSSMTDLVCP